MHDAAQTGELFVHEGIELLAGHERGRPGIGLERFFPCFGLGGLDDDIRQCGTLGRRNTGGTLNTAPVAQHHVKTLLFQGRHINAGQTLF